MSARDFAPDNYRRPQGYHGSPATILRQLEQDGKASLRLMYELLDRFKSGENVERELDMESNDSLYRTIIAARFSATEYGTAACRIHGIEAQGAGVRAQIISMLVAGVADRRCPFSGYRSDAHAAAHFIAEHAGAPKVKATDILQNRKVAKSAYRRASKRLHPDVGGDTRLMQRLTEANATLEASLN